MDKLIWKCLPSASFLHTNMLPGAADFSLPQKPLVKWIKCREAEPARRAIKNTNRGSIFYDVFIGGLLNVTWCARARACGSARVTVTIQSLSRDFD